MVVAAVVAVTAVMIAMVPIAGPGMAIAAMLVAAMIPARDMAAIMAMPDQLDRSADGGPVLCERRGGRRGGYAAEAEGGTEGESE
jgi:hypothetical protein